MKRSLILAMFVLCTILIGSGYAIASLLVERTLTASVTIASQPDLYVLNPQGQGITTIAFGSLSNGAHLTTSISLWNAGNVPLRITMMRTDNVTGISSVFKKGDGSVYDNASPTTLGMGQTLSLSVEIWNTVSVSAGSYQLGFKFSGSS